MEDLETKTKFMKINKRKIEDRKYLITEIDRKKLKLLNKKKFIIIIPYYQIIPKITDKTKSLFVYTTNIITDLYDNLLFIEEDIKTEEDIEISIKEYITNTFQLKSLNNVNIKQVLEVENKKIYVYMVNLGKKKKIINNFLKTNNSLKIKNKNELQIDLDTKYFKKRTFLCFYQDPNYQNSKELKFDPKINKFIYIQLNKLNIYDDINIEFRNSLIFNHL